MGTPLRWLLPLLLGACRPAAPPPDASPPDASPAAPPLATRADTLAWQAYAAMGGPAVWDSVRFVRFDFASQPDEGPPPVNRRRHLWDRRTGDYRLEAVRGDSVYVVLFNTQTKAGQAFQSPARTDPAALAPVPPPQQQAWLDRAYRAFVNDTYWLLQPAKLFDPGVARAYEPDSSRTGEAVLRLSFDRVGLTPGDRYWLYFAPGEALPVGWRFHLEGEDAPGPRIRSEASKTLATPFGPATVRERHRMPGRSVLTDHVALPDTVAAGLFTDPRARLD